MAYLHEDKDQFTEALNLAVFKTGLGPEIIEKDYYVTMILKKLSEQFDYAICPSAMPGVDVSKLLREIESRDVYKEDYNVLTVRLLQESVSYEDVLSVISKIDESGFFNE